MLVVVVAVEFFLCGPAPVMVLAVNIRALKGPAVGSGMLVEIAWPRELFPAHVA